MTMRAPSTAATGAPTGEPADAIFVFAGGQARKEEAAERWRDGGAPILVVSVARYEWRRYPLLGLPGVDSLNDALERVRPRERHFFVILEEEEASIRHVPPRRWGTRNEARALAALAQERGWRSILVITSAFHLPRVRRVVGRVLRDPDVVVAYATPSPGIDPHGPERWWRSRRGIRLVASEIVKRFVYRFLRP